MKTVLSIIGIIALLWLGVLILTHIIEYIVFKYSKDSDWCSITRDTSIYGTAFDEWYIIPTISIYFGFHNKRYPCFQITWLKWIFNCSYHIKTSLEEEAEVKARQELNKEK